MLIKGFPEVLSIHGSWIYGLNAGGSRNNLDMFETNPQYLLKFPSGFNLYYMYYVIYIQYINVRVQYTYMWP